MTNYEVAEAFINQTKAAGRNGTASFWFQGNSISSYATEIGRLINGILYINVGSYSITTTTKHQNPLHWAAHKARVATIGVSPQPRGQDMEIGPWYGINARMQTIESKYNVGGYETAVCDQFNIRTGEIRHWGNYFSYLSKDKDGIYKPHTWHKHVLAEEKSTIAANVEKLQSEWTFDIEGKVYGRKEEVTA